MRNDWAVIPNGCKEKRDFFDFLCEVKKTVSEKLSLLAVDMVS